MSAFSAYCLVSISPLRAEKSDRSEIVSQLLFGELITIHSIEAPWAYVTTFDDNYSGYIDHKHLRRLSQKEVRRWQEGLSFLAERSVKMETPWGPQEIHRGSRVPYKLNEFNIGADPFVLVENNGVQLDALDYARDYWNTPYLWGGKSPYGIDCSGFTQVVYRLFDINLPRDASEQWHCGKEIEFGDHQPNDLAFFENSSGKVTHVGIIDTENRIIHASGWVRIDILTREGIYREDLAQTTHKLIGIRRVLGD